MNHLTTLTPAALRRAADLKDELAGLHNELAALLPTDAPAPTRRGWSAASRRKLSTSMKARWANLGKSPRAPKRRRHSAASRRAISRAAKARWARVHAAGGNRL